MLAAIAASSNNSMQTDSPRRSFLDLGAAADASVKRKSENSANPVISRL